MVYEFIFFEEQFQALITRTAISKTFFSELSKNLEKEQIRLTRLFRDIAVSSKKKEKSETFLHFHQKNLVILMDKVFMAMGEKNVENEEDSEVLKALEMILDKFASFLDWLEVFLPGYFNKNENLPKHRLLSGMDILSSKIKAMATQLNERNFSIHFIEMFNIVFDPFQILKFRDIQYWNTLLDLVSSKLINDEITEEVPAIKLFIDYGVNHVHFYQYAKNFILRQVEQKATLDEQIRAICSYRKEIRLLYSDKKEKQFEKNPAISKALKRLIKEELLVLRAMEFVNQGIGESGIMNANYKVSFSVKQLAFFVHLQMETGLIIWQRAKFAHQYIARHFSTVERESISEKSLRNAHYNHASEDVKKVIAKLSEMLALAQERY